MTSSSAVSTTSLVLMKMQLAALVPHCPIQYVKLCKHSSATTLCISGVPQGLVLGPLLFTAYVSLVRDLIELYSISYHLFADDVQLQLAMNVSDAVLPPRSLPTTQLVSTFDSRRITNSVLTSQRPSSLAATTKWPRSLATGCKLHPS